MAKITIDELSVELKNLLAGTVGDGAELSSLGKKIIAEHFGAPLEPTHTFEEICDVIDNIIDEFKLNLASKGVIPNPDDKIKELVGKVLDIEGRERVYLYNDGDECEDITGGWNSSWNKNDWGNIYTFSKESDKLLFDFTTSDYSTFASICPTNKIDLTNYSKLFIEFNLLALDITSTDSRDFLICFIDGLTDLTYSHFVTMSNYVGAGKVTVSFDISDINGNKYVVPNIKQYAKNKKMNVEIYKLWLEKEPEKINKDNMIELLNNEGIEVDSSETADTLLYKLENDLIEAQKQELRSILISKGMEITDDETTLSDLINRINDFDDIDMTKLWLYREGNAYENITGGFGITWVDTYGSGSTCTMKSDNIEIVYIANDGNYKAATASMLNPIDLTSYKTINIVYTCEGFGSLSLCAANGTGVGTDILASTSIKDAGTNLTASVDISSITGTKYIKFYGWGVSSRTSTLNVYKLWLEK